MKRLPLILLVLGGIVFVAGLVHLFELRFQAGDIYPSYSSLRADPLGTKALLEGLDQLLETERNFQPWNKLGAGTDRTLLLLGCEEDDLVMAPDTFQHLESFASSGGRIVISLYPTYQPGMPSKRRPSPPPPSTSTNTPARLGPRSSPPKKPTVRKESEDDPHRVSIEQRWDFVFDHTRMEKSDEGVYAAVEAERQEEAPEILPATVPIHSGLVFRKLGPGWRSIYAREPEHCVLMERSWGEGSIVLAADSYLFSNEAILQERQPEILAWLVGPATRVIFDETHLGVQENAGVATLLRKYQLHGFFAGLGLLAFLFVWKNAARFMPATAEATEEDSGSVSVAGKESAEGFINLLRRNIPAQDVMSTCLQEWKKSCAHRCDKARLEKIQALIDEENQLLPRKRNPLALYQRIHQVLARKL